MTTPTWSYNQPVPVQYDHDTQAHKKGWCVISSLPVKGDGVQAPGSITLSKTPDEYHPFVVHFFNEQDGGFYSGNYCKTKDEADKAFAVKCSRYMVAV